MVERAGAGGAVLALPTGPHWQHRLVRLNEWVRERFWSIPAVLVVGGVLTAVVGCRPDLLGLGTDWDLGRVVRIQTADTMLQVMASSMLTFVGVLEEAGTIKFVSSGVAGMGMPLLAALIICFIGAVVSAFASSTAILAALIPLAVPFLSTGEIGAVGVICALAVSATIVDVSPFSNNGALVLANAPEGVDKDQFYKRILGYSGIVIVAGPVLAWLALVVPGWL